MSTDKKDSPSLSTSFKNGAVTAAGAVAGIVAVAVTAKAVRAVTGAAVNGIRSRREQQEQAQRAKLVEQVARGLHEQEVRRDRAVLQAAALSAAIRGRGRR